ncbi:histone-like protein (plasmid) [Methanocaldococcus sp. 16A]
MAGEGFPRATLKRIMQHYVDGGQNNFRISKDAVEFMNFVLSGYLKDIMDKARYHAKRNGRKTIKEEDIKVALEQVLKFVRASELEAQKVKAHE